MRYVRLGVRWPLRCWSSTRVAAVSVLGVIQPAAFAAGTPPPQPLGLNHQTHASNLITLPRTRPSREQLPPQPRHVVGCRGATPIAKTTNPTYTETNLSSTTVYSYEVTAVNSAEESPRCAEDVSKTPPPVGTGGHTPGRGLSGNSQVYDGRTRCFTRSASGHFDLTI